MATDRGATIRYHDVMMLFCNIEGGGYVASSGIGECIGGLALLTGRAQKRTFKFREVHRFRFRLLPSDENAEASKNGGYQQRPVMFGDTVRLQHVTHETLISEEKPKDAGLAGLTLNNSIDPDEDDNRMQCFQIMPASQVREEGILLRAGDEILLMRVEARTSMCVLPGAVTERLGVAFHNIVMNPHRQSVFVVELESAVSLPETVVRVGVPLVLYHKVSLTMLGFQTPKLDQSTENLGVTYSAEPFHDTKAKGELTKKYLSSLPVNISSYGDIAVMRVDDVNRATVRSSYFYQFENAASIGGGPLNNYTQYRIRHMPTNRFVSIFKRFLSGGLHVKESLEPVLTEDVTDPSTRFQIRVCQSDSSTQNVEVTIAYLNLIQLESVHYPGVWLEVQDGKLTCSKFCHFEQSFEIVEPFNGQVATLTAATKFYPAICQYLTTHHASLCPIVIYAIEKMIYFVTDDTEERDPLSPGSLRDPLEERQDVLIDANAHLLVLKLLDDFIRSQLNTHGIAVCYRLLTLMIKSRPQNAAFLSPFVGFLVEQLSQPDPVGAMVAETILELYTDNILLLSSLPGETLRIFLEHLATKRNSRYADVVQTLCITKSEGYHRNQTLVLEQLFSSVNPYVQRILPKMTMEKDTVMIADHRTGKMQSFAKFESKPEDTQYLGAIFELLASVAKGNQKSCDMIAKMNLSDIIFKIVLVSKVESLKAAALSLLIEYQNSGSSDQTLTVKGWASLTESDTHAMDEPVVRMNFAVNELALFNRVKAWACKYFQTVESMSAENKEMCTMVRAIGKVLYRLVHLGLYDDLDERSELAESCLTALDNHGCSEEVQKDSNHGEGDDDQVNVTSDNALLVAAKIELLRILNLLVYHDAQRHVNAALVRFKRQCNDSKKNEGYHVDVRDLVMRADAYPEWLPPLSISFPIIKDTLRYRHTALVEEALTFLVRTTGMARYVHECLVTTTLLDTEFLSLSHGPFLKEVRELEMRAADATLGPHYISPQLENILKLLKGSCQENQKLMRACGLAKSIKSILENTSWSLQDDSTHCMYALCCRVIVLYCKDNSQHQSDFAPSVGILLELLEKGAVGIGMMEALSEIFRNNASLLQSMEEKMISRVVELSKHDHVAVEFLQVIVTRGNEWHQSNLGTVSKHIRMNKEVSSCKYIGDSVESVLLNDGEYYALFASSSKIAYHLMLLELCAAMVHVHAAQVDVKIVLSMCAQPLSSLPLYYKTSALRALRHFIAAEDVSPEELLKVLGQLQMEINVEEAITQAYVAKWGRYKLRMRSYEMPNDPYDTEPMEIVSAITRGTASSHFYGKKTNPGGTAAAQAIPLEAPDVDDKVLGSRVMNLDRERFYQEHHDFVWKAIAPLLTTVLLSKTCPRDSTKVSKLYFSILNEAAVKQLSNCEDPTTIDAAVALYLAGRSRATLTPSVRQRMDDIVSQRQHKDKGSSSQVDANFALFCTQYFVTAATCYEPKSDDVPSVGAPPYEKLLKQKGLKKSDLKMVEMCAVNKNLNYDLRRKVFQIIITKLREEWHPDMLLRNDDALADYLKLITEGQNATNNMEPKLSHVAFLLLGNPQLFACALECLIGLLNKGNRAVQRSILECSRQHSGEIMMTMRKKLSTASMMMITLDKTVQVQEPQSYDTVTQLDLLCHSTVRLLRFLQLLSEGHNASLQNYLRVQPEKKNSVNLVKDVVNLFTLWVTIISKDVMPIGIQCLQTLTEFCQGPCLGNQQELVENGLAAALGKIILGKINRYEALSELAPDSVNELTKECVTLLLALTEGLTRKSSVPAQLLSMIPTSELINRANEYWVRGNIVNYYTNVSPFTKEAIDAEPDDEGDGSILIEVADIALRSSQVGPLGAVFMIQSRVCPEKKLEYNEEEESYPASTELGISLFIYLLGLSRFHKPLREDLERQMSFPWYFERVGAIEIHRVDLDQLERVLFPIPLRCRYLTEDAKNKFTEDVDRTSISTKLNYLIEQQEDIIQETNIYSKVAQNAFVGIFVHHSFLIEMLSITSATALTIFLILTMHKANRLENFFLSETEFFIFRILAIIQLVQEFWVFFGWMVLNGQVHFRKSVSWQIRRLKHRIQFGEDNEEVNAELRRWCTFTRKPWWWQMKQFILMFATWNPFWIQVLFAAAAPLGYTLNPIFFSIQIFRVVKHNVQIQNVVSAVTLRANDLILASFLASLLIFFFSFFAFMLFSDKFYSNQNDDMGTGFTCATLQQCFVVILLYGVRTEGGIGWIMASPSWFKATETGLRLTFEFLFWIVLVIIFMSIIKGIILDTFAELRDMRQERLKDMSTQCFICGIESHEFDKVRGHSFVKHYREEHNQWDYVRFFHYLSLKQHTEYTGQESYVSERLKIKDTSFFPIDGAVVLEDKKESSTDETRDLEVLRKLNDIEKIYTGHLTDLTVNAKRRHASSALQKLQEEEEEAREGYVQVGGSESGTPADSVMPASAFDSEEGDRTIDESAWVTESEHSEHIAVADEEKEGFLTDKMRASMMTELTMLITRNHQRTSTMLENTPMDKK